MQRLDSVDEVTVPASLLWHGPEPEPEEEQPPGYPPSGSLSITHCNLCWNIRVCYMRNELDYAVYTGWTCDECDEWIDVRFIHCQLSMRMEIADHHRTHPLTQLLMVGIETDEPFEHIGHLIASFILRRVCRVD